MDKTVRIISDLVEQEAETFRYWQNKSATERIQATWELSNEFYTAYNKKHGINAEGSMRTFAQLRHRNDGE